jgi:hypothetical protein
MSATLDRDHFTVQHRAISDGESYPLATFRQITGLSDSAMRAARRAGLPVRRVGKRGFILGRDWSAFLANQK